jgi:hypothetical protein
VIEPYYAGRWATLYLGDCRDIAPTLEPRSVDLLVADPPYGVGWQSNRRSEKFDRMAGDDGSTDWPAALGAIGTRLLRNHRHVYVFGYGPDLLTEPLSLSGTAELIWDKEHLGPGNLELPWGPEHERFTFGVYNWSRVNREKGHGRLAARLRQGSVVQAKRPVSGQVRHPSEKPVPLLRALVEASSCLGETVLDPTWASARPSSLPSWPGPARRRDRARRAVRRDRRRPHPAGREARRRHGSAP